MLKPLLISGSIAAAMTLFAPSAIRGELDLPFVNSRIDNLEARTTNNESDIKQLQATTGTALSDHVAVPSAPTAPTTTSTTTSAPTSSGAVSAPQPVQQPAATTAPAAAPTPVIDPTVLSVPKPVKPQPTGL